VEKIKEELIEETSRVAQALTMELAYLTKSTQKKESNHKLIYSEQCMLSKLIIKVASSLYLYTKKSKDSLES